MPYTYTFDERGNHWMFRVSRQVLFSALEHILPTMVKRLKHLEATGGSKDIIKSFPEFAPSPNAKDLVEEITKVTPKRVLLNDWRHVPDNFEFIVEK